MEQIRNYSKSMSYRTFGKTGKKVSVITLGGMRYVHGWEDPRDQVPPDMIQQATTCVRLALQSGINHIETAYGYGKSEHCYGQVLNKELSIPRDSYYLMTKGAPESQDALKKMIAEQVEALQTDHFDFYAWHGINNRERFNLACAKGGPVEGLLRLRDQGVIGSVGFSTHAPLDVILDAINTGLFDFVNLHYYYFFQRNNPAVDEAVRRNMGVFIISPNDKGGRLFEAPELLRHSTAPVTPIQWNARFCLSTPRVHTLSFGMTAPEHFEEMRGVCVNGTVPWDQPEKATLSALDARINIDPVSAYDGYDIPENESGLNIPEILRFRKMWKCYGMDAWCRYRYNMFEEKGHWFPGGFATEENIAGIPDHLIPAGIPLKEMLREFHRAFFDSDKHM